MKSGARFTLALLTVVYVLNFVDRQLIGILGQPMKMELGLSDKQLGLLNGLAFALFNSLLGLPIARIAERRSRVAVVGWSLGLWSIATTSCGFARGLPQLLIARIGVGIGEAGYVPAAQSLIADHWPSERRATALAIFSLGIPIGILVGAVAGGWIAESLGWRSAFVTLGIPGVIVALAIALFSQESPRGQTPSGARPAPAFGAVARSLFGDPLFRNLAAGATLASTAGYGITNFSVPFLMRTYHLPLPIAASGFGLVVGIGIGIGIAAGGWIADRLSARHRDVRATISALGTMIGLVGFAIALAQDRPALVAIAAIPAFIGAHLYFGPVYAATADRATPQTRATAVAILLLAMNGIGLSIGPTLVGLLSDQFTAHGLAGFAQVCAGVAAQRPDCLATSARGLTSALAIDLLFYLWATAHFLRAAQILRRPQPQSSAR